MIPESVLVCDDSLQPRTGFLVGVPKTVKCPPAILGLPLGRQFLPVLFVRELIPVASLASHRSRLGGRHVIPILPACGLFDWLSILSISNIVDSFWLSPNRGSYDVEDPRILRWDSLKRRHSVFSPNPIPHTIPHAFLENEDSWRAREVNTKTP